MTDQLLGAVILAVLVGTMAFTGLGVFEQTASVTGGTGGDRVDAAAALDGTEWVAIGNHWGNGYDETVVNSRGHAYQFTGADDSYLTSESSVAALGGANWTVMQGVWVNQSATGANMTVLVVGDPNLVLEYRGNQSTAQWSAYYYDGAHSYRVDIDAPDPTNASVIWVTRNASTLTIHRGTTAGESVTVGTDSAASGNLSAAENCHCRLDETRVWHRVVDDQERSDLVANPVQATTGEKAARILYDRKPGIPIFYAGTSATASNVTLGDGFDGQEMERDGTLSSGDYEWRASGPDIKPTADGRLANAPVAFAEYTLSDETRSWSEQLATTMSNFSMVFLVLALVVIVGYLKLLL